LPQDLLMDERTYRRHRRIRALADAGNAVEISRNLLADGHDAMQGVEQHNGQKPDCKKPQGMPEREEDNAHGTHERSQPSGSIRRLARDLVKRLGRLHRFLGSGRVRVGKFEGFGNLKKALTFLPQCAAGVAEGRVSEHARLIHAFDAGQDRVWQQQSSLFDQLGQFREVQPGCAEDQCGVVLGGLGHGRILRVHLLHGPFQECHVIYHRRTSPATIASLAHLVRRRPLAP
jgi:hypothetical protein